MLQNSPVTTRLMGVEEARASGARALFGEKYGDEVRVVAMGRNQDAVGGADGSAHESDFSERDAGGKPVSTFPHPALGWSVELCGGTHARRTGDIGLISVTGESAVGAGVRRIEAVTGRVARKSANGFIALAKQAAAELRTPVEELPARLGALVDERKRAERELADARKKLAMGGGTPAAGAADAPNGVRTVGAVKLFAREVAGIEMKDLKSLADEGKRQVGSGVVAIVGVTADGKAGIVVGVTADLTERFNAVDLVRKGAEALGGKGGGGRPDMAQAGGPNGADAQAAIEAIAAAMGAA